MPKLKFLLHASVAAYLPRYSLWQNFMQSLGLSSLLSLKSHADGLQYLSYDHKNSQI